MMKKPLLEGVPQGIGSSLPQDLHPSLVGTSVEQLIMVQVGSLGCMGETFTTMP
jgi:hypothetical protein